MTIEYAAIWRAWELTERDMRRLRFRMTLWRMSRGMNRLGQASAIAMAGLSAFNFAIRAAEADAIRQMRAEAGKSGLDL